MDDDETRRLVAKYMEGMCHVFAVAMHRRHTFGFLMLTDSRSFYAPGVPTIHHVYADDGQGNLYDACGRHDRENLVSQWTEEDGYGVLELDHESDLEEFVGIGVSAPLCDYSESDVEDAATAINRLLGDVMRAETSDDSQVIPRSKLR